MKILNGIARAYSALDLVLSGVYSFEEKQLLMSFFCLGKRREREKERKRERADAEWAIVVLSFYLIT